MADISKIKLPDGTTYDIKDEGARANYVSKSAELLTTNPFAPSKLKGPYISKIDNAFYCADKRWSVSITNVSGAVSSLFDGDYEGGLQINGTNTAVVTFDFENGAEATGYFPGYPYGNIIVNFYYVAGPATVTGRVYCNYSGHGIGWHDITFAKVTPSDAGAITYIARNSYYQISKLEISIKGDTSNSYGYTRITEIEMHLDRPMSNRNPFLSKYGAETLYYNLTAPTFIGNLTGTASKATADASGNTITTHYAPKSTAVTNVAHDTTNHKITKTINGTTTDVVGAASTSTYGITKLNSATNSTSTTEAATPSAVKTAKDRADEAYSKAATVESGLNGTLIYDHTYSISNGVATFTAHVYQKGVEVTSNYADSCFSWSYKLANAVTGTPSVVSLGTGKTKTITISTLGYGGYVLGTFTPA